MNKLKNEKSPYLQQHSSNPVDWYPWGDEAFDKARKENKPIFVSIGYATCHWCHVMAHESFEDGEVADILNKNFISIKVDREERPDIDSIYMTVCQMMTGQGGWPLSIFISPNKDPFFAGTYFPKESKGHRLGFKDLLERVSDIWLNKRAEVQTTLDNVRDALVQAKGSQVQGPPAPAQELTQKITAELVESFDPKNGGFGTAPKFPSSHKLQFLLDQFCFLKKTSQKNKSQDSEILNLVEKSLCEMHRGGFYDHIGGGVHRYSTDEAWELPHFEKMLYDQANCALTYVNAYQVTQNILYRKIAEDILNFCIRDMKLPTGGYASAYDADSEGEEGKFYVWSWEELSENLSEGEFAFLKLHYNLSEDGNFHDEATGEKVDKNIFFLKKSFHQVSPGQIEKFFQEFETIKLKLFNSRNKRIKPLLDDKVLCDWNSFLAVALFRAGHVFGNPRYVQEAVNILDFLDRNLLDFSTEGDELYFHRCCDGDTLKISFLDDQSYMMWALTEAYATTLDTSYLLKLEKLFNVTYSKFGDSQAPGMYLTPEKQEVIVTRTKEVYDGAHPSGSAVFYYAAILYGRLTRNDKLLKDIEAQLEKLSSEFIYSPSSFGFWGRSYLLLENSYPEIHIRGASSEEKKALEGFLKKTYRPGLIYHGDNKIVLTSTPQDVSIQVFPDSTKLQIYLCQDFVCLQPMSTVAELEKSIEKH